MRPQLFQAFIPFHAAQMGAPPVHSRHFDQHFSSTIPNSAFPFSFMFPWNAPGVSPFQRCRDVVMNDVCSDSDDMDVDPITLLPEPMDIDFPLLPSIYPTDEPMDVDLPPIDLVTFLDGLTLSNEVETIMEPDPHIDSYPHPEDCSALVLSKPNDKAVISYTQNQDLLERADAESLVNSPSTNSDKDTDLPEGVEGFEGLVEHFRLLTVNDDDDKGTENYNPEIPSSPTSEDADTKCSTSGSFHESKFPFLTALEDYFIPSPLISWEGLMAHCKLKAHLRGRKSDCVVEEPSQLSLSDTASDVAISVSLNGSTILDADYPSIDTSFTDIPSPSSDTSTSSPELKKIRTNTDEPRTPDHGYSGIHATPTRYRRMGRPENRPYRRPRSLRIFQSNDSFESAISESRSLSPSGQLPTSPAQIDTPQTPPKTTIIKPTNDLVFPGAFPIHELETLELEYRNRPPFTTVSPKYWVTFTQWTLELICGW